MRRLASLGMMLVLSVTVGCASMQTARPPAASFEGTLSEQIVPASLLGPEWRLEKGLMIDDITQPTTLPVMRRAWAEKFLRQRSAAGARSYGEVFYFSPETPPNKVSTLILVYQDAEKARAQWDDTYGPGQFTYGYKRTKTYGDKSVQNSKYDEIVMLAGNVILQVSQPMPGTANEMVLEAYIKQLGLDQLATAP